MKESPPPQINKANINQSVKISKTNQNTNSNKKCCGKK
jgi:hypothetical protein